MGSCLYIPPNPIEKHHSDVPDPHLPHTRFLNDELPSWFPAANAHNDISCQFLIKDKIGDGITGSVFSILYAKNNEIYALKRIPRNDEYGRMQFITEARCLSRLKHPSIIKYIDMLMDGKYYYLILEKCDYDLRKLIASKKRLSEHKTKRIIYSLLGSITYIHKLNLVHKDIKPENIVFHNNDTYTPKLIDFGDADMAKKDKIYTELVGTPAYMSPERLGEHNDIELKKSDIWAIGAVAYEMYSGHRCFEGDSQKQLFSKILLGKWEWTLERKPSQNMQDFVKQCLHLNVEKRLSAFDALQHVWFAGMTDTTSTPIDDYDTIANDGFESSSGTVKTI